MGGRGSFSNGFSSLRKINYNPKWLYQPDDETDISDLAKNPIPYVGIGEDEKIGRIIEDGQYKKNTKATSKLIFLNWRHCNRLFLRAV